ncbi:MAG: pseudouridine synthase, partial [Bacilli bacterium]
MRLDKFLSSCGIGTRKEVKKLIKDKRISVNGSFNVKDSMNINELEDEVMFDDEILEYKEFYYILLNKPKGYLSATEDNYAPTVLDLVSEYSFVSLFPVGRLDKDTTGCLLLTNDGPLAHRLLSPKYHVDKVYEVEIDKEMNNFEKVKSSFEKGIPMDDDTTLPAKIIMKDSTHFELTLHQGKFHQVKRMFEYFSYKVINLNRKKFAFLDCSSLEQGEYRLLT